MNPAAEVAVSIIFGLLLTFLALVGIYQAAKYAARYLTGRVSLVHGTRQG